MFEHSHISSPPRSPISQLICSVPAKRRRIKSKSSIGIDATQHGRTRHDCPNTSTTSVGHAEAHCRESASTVEHRSALFQKKDELHEERADSSPSASEIVSDKSCGPEKPASANSAVVRVLKIKRSDFTSSAVWGFKVLNMEPLSNTKTSTDKVSLVQRSFRSLVKCLHPDKVGNMQGAGDALDLVQSARDVCIRALSAAGLPLAPKHFRARVLDSKPGKRKFELCWDAPDTLLGQHNEVHSYIISVCDDKMAGSGCAMRLAVLEPYYCETRQRFLGVDELGSHIVSEVEVPRLAELLRNDTISWQVTAANSVGQSRCTICRMALTATCSQATSSRTVQRELAKSCRAPTTMLSLVDIGKFSGQELRTWLRAQRRKSLVIWLRERQWPTTGTTDDLIDRVVFVVEGSQAAHGGA